MKIQCCSAKLSMHVLSTTVRRINNILLYVSQETIYETILLQCETGFATAPSFTILSPGKCCHCLARHQGWILTEHP